MARLDGALKSAKTKKTDADAKAKADADAKAKADADAKAKADADAAKNSVIAPLPDVTAPPVTPLTGDAAAGSTGTPSTGLTVSTGDAQLDRVQGINIDQIRDQRMGGSGSGMRDPRMGPTSAQNPNGNPNGAYGGSQPNGMAGMNNPQNPNTQPMNQVAPQDNTAPKETPVYKKWWFWVVVGVSAIVVYEIAFDSSSTNSSSVGHESTTFGNTRTNAGIGAQSSSGGFTLHF